MSRFPNARFLLSVAAPGQFPPDHGAEVAFAGRSNAGKSSAINTITQRHTLARTSKTPGHTRLLNYFELGANQRLVDLPGYGYASVAEAERRKWVPLLEALRQRRSLCGLFLIVDSRRGVGPQDEELIEWAGYETRGVHVLLSKADKLSRNEATTTLRAAERLLRDRATVQLFSSLNKTGVDQAQKTLLYWLANGGPKEKTPATSGEITGAD